MQSSTDRRNSITNLQRKHFLDRWNDGVRDIRFATHPDPNPNPNPQSHIDATMSEYSDTEARSSSKTPPSGHPRREGNDSLWKRARRTLGTQNLGFLQPAARPQGTFSPLAPTVMIADPTSFWAIALLQDSLYLAWIYSRNFAGSRLKRLHN